MTGKVALSGKYQAYPEYKNSGVEWLGDIPKHWELTRIKYITQCLDGARIPLNAQERGEMQGDIPYWGANRVVDYVNDFLFDEELVLLGEDGAPFFDDTKDVAFNVFGKIWPNNHVHVLRPYLNKIEPHFLKYALNCADYHLYISGSTRDKLNQSDMNEIYIRVAELPELKQVADFLDHETTKIDTLIDKQQQLIQLLKEKRQAVISHAVTKGLNPNAPMRDSGVEWLGEVPEHWELWKLAHAFDGIGSGTTPPSGEEKWYEGDIPWVTTGELRESTIIKTRKNVSSETIAAYPALRKYPVGSVVIAMYGATIGRLGILGIEATTNQACCVFSNSKIINNRYLFFWLQAYKEEIIALSSGGGQPNINQEKVASLKISAPNFEEQAEITTYLDKVIDKYDAVEYLAEKQIHLLKERRTALISAAVTGKIDVRNWQAS